MTDLTLFDLEPVGRARRTDPETSVRAARMPRTGIRARIVEVFRTQERLTRHLGRVVGLTDDELVVRLGPNQHAPTIKTARSALTNAGILEWTGFTRPSNTGHDMRVYRLKREGVIHGPTPTLRHA